MSETTIIPTGTSGFHSTDGQHKDGLASLLLFQETANEGRHNQKVVFDTALSSRDAIDRVLISSKTDAERIQARIDETRLETIKQIEEVKSLMFKLEDARIHRELADAKAEIQILKLRSTSVAA